MISYRKALEIVCGTAPENRSDREYVPVAKSLGRITAARIESKIDLPPFNRSAMDGYAIPKGEILDEYIVDGILPAGKTWDDPVEPGHCVKVMTGAPVFDGASHVIMWEKTEFEDDKVRILDKESKKNIALKGEDLREGDLLCDSGMLITPAILASLVMGGISEVPVHQVPRAAIFSTGDELIPISDTITPGKIYDSNGPMLRALLSKYGVGTSVAGHIDDDLDASVNAIKQGLANADIIILTGAVSKGDYDFIPQALEKCWVEVLFDEVAIKPGKPLTFCTKDDKLIFGLPGNPVSAFLLFHLFVLPAIYRRQGFNAVPKSYECKLNSELNIRPAIRDHFIPVTVESDGGVKPVEYHGSGHLVALSDADGFVLIESGRTGLKAGDKALFIPVMNRLYHAKKPDLGG